MENLNSRVGPECAEFLYLEPKAIEEINTFAVTRYELIQILKYWYTVGLRIAWEAFQGDFCSIGASKEAFGEIRIDQIRELLNQEDVNTAISEASDEFSRKVQPAEWQTFIERDESTMKSERKWVIRDLVETSEAISSLNNKLP